MSDSTVPSAPVSSPLVERLVSANQTESPASDNQEQFAAAMRTLGYASVFDIIREPRDVFARKLVDVWSAAETPLALRAYDNALCYAAQASLVYRRQLLSSGWVPNAGQRTGLRSLVDVGPSYPKLFKENWDAFCRSGALEAIDSPVAYLVDILRFAQSIETHGDAGKLTLSQRRPDIFAASDATSGGLLIDQASTFDPIPVLDIANEVVRAKIEHYLDGLPANERPAASVEAWFAALRHPFLFPYVASAEQIRLGLESTLGQLLYRGSLQPTPFSAVMHVEPDEPVGYAPIALTDLSRERQLVLLEEPDVAGAAAFKAYVNANYGLAIETDDAQELQQVRLFLKQTALDGDELDEMLARGKHEPVVSPHYQPTTQPPEASPAGFGAVYINNDGTSTLPLTLSDPGSASDSAPLQLQATTPQRFVRLNKMMRLRRWLDVPFADLDALVTAAQQAEGVTGASTLTQTTLRVLGAYRYFAKKYGVKADAFAALFGDLVPYSVAGQGSLFDRTFNSAALLDSPLVIDEKPFGDATTGADDAVAQRTMLQLCAGLGLKPDEREYGRAATFVKAAIGGDLKRSLPVVSAFYRLARVARLFGLGAGDYLDLLEMLGGDDAVKVVAGGTLSTLAVVSLTYAHTTVAYAVGKPATPNKATLIGIASPTFTVTPSLPTGLSLNPSTGEIKGTPTVVAADRTYVVTAKGTDESTTASLHISVVEAVVMDVSAMTGAMNTPRYGHAAVQIKKGGKPFVLVTGGSQALNLSHSSAELYDPDSGEWSPVTSMKNGRSDHIAVLLPSGKVLVAGGDGPRKTAEVYDPEKDTWTSVGNLNYQRSNHSAVVVQGRVYVVGGQRLASQDQETEGEVFDESTGVWKKTRPLGHAFYSGQATTDGTSIFVTGGSAWHGAALDSSHKYDPAKDTWTTLAPLPGPRSWHTSLSIATIYRGIFGGSQAEAIPADLPWLMSTAEGWREVQSLNDPRIEAQAIPHTPNGVHVVLIGGTSSVIERVSGNADDAGVPARVTGQLLMTHNGGTVTALDDSNRRILVVGGIDAGGNILASAEVVTIDPAWEISSDRADRADRVPGVRATPSTGDALDLLLRVDWIVDWLKANKKTVADLHAIFGSTPVEESAAIEDIARRIHQGLPGTRLTNASIAALDLPANDDNAKPIAWDPILARMFDPVTGLVIEPLILLGVPPEWQLLETITIGLAPLALEATQKTDIAARVAEVVGAARRAQCGLLEAELAHDSGLSPDQVTLVLIWSGTTPQDMLAPLIDEEAPTVDWLALLSTFKRHAKALVDTKLSAVALHTFLAEAGWLDAAMTTGMVPTLSLSTYYLMHRYRTWLNTTAGSEDDVIRYLAVANTNPAAGDEAAFKRRCADRLAPLLGWVAGDVLRATATLPGGVATSIQQIEWLLRVGEAAEEAGVPVPCALQLGGLNGTSPSEAWTDAGASVYSAVRGRALGPIEMDAPLSESRRDALVTLYLTQVVPKDPLLIAQHLETRIQTPNDLYEYLLLDTQVSQQVQTSRVASAMASVQQYINGILMGMEPGYATWQPPLEATEGLVSEVVEWRDQKSQYPLWAANQQLRYFPELYINPTLRLGKSGYFEELEQTINQNRIHIDTVRKAVLAYLNTFEEVANLTIVNGYASTDDFANATYYFVGKSRGTNTYYWRKVDMSQRPAPVGSIHKGDTLNPSAWSDWKRIDLPVSEATVERSIRPVFFNERLYVVWVDWYPSGMPVGDVPDDTSVKPPQVRLSGIYKEYDDSWSAPQVYIDGKVADTTLTKAEIHSFAFHDVHLQPQKMIVGTYGGATTEGNISGHGDKYKMMWNARLDHSFNVEGIWPHDGKAGAFVGTDPDERYVRFACHQFSSRLAKRYIQFPMTGTTTRLRDATDGANSPWEGVHNSAIAGIGVWNLVNYEFELDGQDEKLGYAVVTCRLREHVSGPVNLFAKWQYLPDGVTSDMMDIEFTRPDGPLVVLEPSNVLYRSIAPYDVDWVSFPSVPYSEDSWQTRQFRVHGPFKPGYLHSFVDSLVEREIFPSGYGSFTHSDGRRFVFKKRPLLTYRREPTKKYKLAIFYAPNKVIQAGSAAGSYTLKTLASTAASADGLPQGAEIVFRIPVGKTLFPLEGDWAHTQDGGFQIAYGLVEYEADGTTFAGHDLKYSTIWLEDYNEVSMPVAPQLGTTSDNALGVAEFIDFRGSSIEYSDGSTSHKRPSIRMNTLFVKDLIRRTNTALENLLSWETQSLSEPVIPDGPSPATMDFKGANGKYFWELFFHLPFSIAHRFHSEQQFADSDKWLQFIFDPSYKGVPPGEDLASSVRRPYWLVRPLDWINDPAPELSQALRAPLDPDGQASAFPVHYRKAVYFLFIRNLMMRGDWAYRDLTPDSLNEAKLWYVRALDLMGPRPDVLLSDRWKPTLLKDIVASENAPLRALAESMGEPGLAAPSLWSANAAPSWNRSVVPLQSQPFVRDTFLGIDDTDPSYFRVPFNGRLVELWDQLESRLDNLRHNRTIDGKPLQLPIFAPPLDPSVLLARFAAGGTSRSAGRLGLTVVPHYRYQTMFARASLAVETLIQFGQLLLSYVERKEQAELSELQQGQLWEISQFAIDLQLQMQGVESANEEALRASKRLAENRKAYYDARLADGGVSSEEASAAVLHMTGRTLEGVASAAFLVAYALKAIPNIFGVANGGQDVEGPPEGAARSIAGSASVAHGAAEALDRAAIIKRRNEEWTLQRDQAELELAQLDEQLNVLATQRITTATQLRQAQLARQQAEQIYTFLSKRFTNASLYGWLVSQLSTFYYQAYDTTLSLSLAAEACWQYEIGDFSVRFVEPGKWKDAYRGLTVGEGLRLNLLKMDAAYVNRHERHLVIGKTISVKALYERKHGTSWGQKWADDVEKGALSFEIEKALLEADYPDHVLRRIRRVGVSIPGVVGAYQDIRAILTQTSNTFDVPNGEAKANVRASQQIVVSRGIDDDGLMMEPQAIDDRYLPFEGTGAISSWNLTFPEAETDEQQQALLQSLNDVIVHLTYTARPGGAISRSTLRLPEGIPGR